MIICLYLGLVESIKKPDTLLNLIKDKIQTKSYIKLGITELIPCYSLKREEDKISLEIFKDEVKSVKYFSTDTLTYEKDIKKYIKNINKRRSLLGSNKKEYLVTDTNLVKSLNIQRVRSYLLDTLIFCKQRIDKVYISDLYLVIQIRHKDHLYIIEIGIEDIDLNMYKDEVLGILYVKTSNVKKFLMDWLDIKMLYRINCIKYDYGYKFLESKLNEMYCQDKARQVFVFFKELDDCTCNEFVCIPTNYVYIFKNSQLLGINTTHIYTSDTELLVSHLNKYKDLYQGIDLLMCLIDKEIIEYALDKILSKEYYVLCVLFANILHMCGIIDRDELDRLINQDANQIVNENEPTRHNRSLDSKKSEVDYNVRKVNYNVRKVDYNVRKVDYNVRKVNYNVRKVNYNVRKEDYNRNLKDKLYKLKMRILNELFSNKYAHYLRFILYIKINELWKEDLIYFKFFNIIKSLIKQEDIKNLDLAEIFVNSIFPSTKWCEIMQLYDRKILKGVTDILGDVKDFIGY